MRVREKERMLIKTESLCIFFLFAFVSIYYCFWNERIRHSMDEWMDVRMRENEKKLIRRNKQINKKEKKSILTKTFDTSVTQPIYRPFHQHHRYHHHHPKLIHIHMFIICFVGYAMCCCCCFFFVAKGCL